MEEREDEIEEDDELCTLYVTTGHNKHLDGDLQAILIFC